MRALVVLGVSAVAATGVLQLAGIQGFETYFGALTPWFATALVTTVGAGALLYLDSAGWFSVRGNAPPRRLLPIGMAAAAAFVVPVLVLDVLGGFPADLNVRSPWSLLFYPVMGLVAESAFHAVPLALLLLGLGPVAHRLSRTPTKRSCMVLVALIEPTMQTVWSSPESPAWVVGYVALHVFAINLTVLYLFDRFDFLTAYGFRTLYYLFWHVAWGAIRLPLLFGA
jgi:hypothetical protein